MIYNSRAESSHKLPAADHIRSRLYREIMRRKNCVKIMNAIIIS